MGSEVNAAQCASVNYAVSRGCCSYCSSILTKTYFCVQHCCSKLQPATFFSLFLQIACTLPHLATLFSIFLQSCCTLPHLVYLLMLETHQIAAGNRQWLWWEFAFRSHSYEVAVFLSARDGLLHTNPVPIASFRRAVVNVPEAQSFFDRPAGILMVPTGRALPIEDLWAAFHWSGEPRACGSIAWVFSALLWHWVGAL